ncbi:hypothetical protein NE237_030616 [Protea cynaroides]|uniref:Histone H2A n=1 Tax=Protea cynaroides TaxID=273540 RepID=A0A9Q0GY71_9MAGN|nr:hypothetical protein NE237_030616 [Protea cynaroides]
MSFVFDQIDAIENERSSIAKDSCLKDNKEKEERDNEKNRIIRRHVLLAVRNDYELRKLLAGVTIAHGGVLPNINPVFSPKKSQELLEIEVVAWSKGVKCEGPKPIVINGPSGVVADAGKRCIFDIDVEGARQVRASSLEAIFIFICSPLFEELEK